MSLAVDDLGTTDDEGTRRDRYGRYLVLPPDGTKPVAYTRATTIAKAIEDQHSLIAWKARVTAIGLTKRPELLKMIAVTDDRKALDRLCEDAAASGGATERRDEGTALHRAIERSLVGEPVPELFRRDVDAVHHALKKYGFSVLGDMVEVMVVDDTRKIAGRFDMMIKHDTTVYIADIKTGASLDYSGCAFAAQLAIYANADCVYKQGRAANGSQDERTPLPPVSRDVAYILHVQPGSGRCDIHAVDIAYGSELVDLNLKVREARNKGRTLITPHSSPLTARVEAVDPPEATPSAPARSGIVERIEVLKLIDTAAPQLAALWPAGVPGLKSGHVHSDAELAQIEKAVRKVEANVDGPLHPDPFFVHEAKPLIEPPAPREPSPLDRRPDEGPDAEPADIETLSAELAALPDDQQEFVAALVAEAHRHHHPISLKRTPSTRRVAIVRALLMWSDLDTEALTAGLVAVVGDWVEQFPPGAVIGVLTAEEAERLLDLGIAMQFGPAHLTYLDTGECRISIEAQTNNTESDTQ